MTPQESVAAGSKLIFIMPTSADGEFVSAAFTQSSRVMIPRAEFAWMKSTATLFKRGCDWCFLAGAKLQSTDECVGQWVLMLLQPEVRTCLKCRKTATFFVNTQF